MPGLNRDPPTAIRYYVESTNPHRLAITKLGDFTAHIYCLHTIDHRRADVAVSVNFDRGELTIRDGKGGKDRVTMLPAAITGPLADHLNRVKAQHDADLAAGRGSVALLGSLRAKYPNAPFEWAHDAVHIVERYTPVTPNTIKYEATFDDPKVYTRARGRWF